MAQRSLAKPVDATSVLAHIAQRHLENCRRGFVIFRESEAADAVYFIESGRVKLTRVSESGREAIIALLTEGDFLGEGCLIGEPQRLTSAECLSETRLWRIDKEYLLRLVRSDEYFSEMLLSYLLSRNERYQEDLADQLFNSTEKRLARTLLLLAHFGASGEPLKIVTPLSHATLAEIVGTTRARVTTLMNRFRRLRYIEYDRRALHVNASLLKVLLRD